MKEKKKKEISEDKQQKTQFFQKRLKEVLELEENEFKVKWHPLLHSKCVFCEKKPRINSVIIESWWKLAKRIDTLCLKCSEKIDRQINSELKGGARKRKRKPKIIKRQRETEKQNSLFGFLGGKP